MYTKRVVITAQRPFVAVEVGITCRPGDELDLPFSVANALIAAGLAKEPAQTEEGEGGEVARVESKPRRRR